MRTILAIIFMTFATQAVQARVVATFNCEVISANALAIKEGRETYSRKADEFYEKQVQITVTMEPDPRFDRFYQVKTSTKASEDLLPAYTNFPISSYDVEVIRDEIRGHSFHGGFRLTSDIVRFFSHEAGGISLNRYYRDDFDGLMVPVLMGRASWTLGLNCQSSKYNHQDFINFHNSWTK